MFNEETESKKFNVYAGATVHWLTVLEVFNVENCATKSSVRVRCRCGVFKTVNYVDLRYGKIKSCGCSRKEPKVRARKGFENRSVLAKRFVSQSASASLPPVPAGIKAELFSLLKKGESKK